MTKKVEESPETPAKPTIQHPLIIPARPPVHPVIFQSTDVGNRLSKVITLTFPAKDRSSESRNSPARQVSKSELAMTSKGRAVSEKSKVPEKKPSSTPRHSAVTDVSAVRPAASQPATSNKSLIRREKNKKPGPVLWRFPVSSVSASQPATGSKRARSPSPQTPFNSPEGSQQSIRRRQPPRNSSTPVLSYNVKRRFRYMMGSLDGPEYQMH
ncbi:hypothetical protein F4679DRAFT_552869 [Xylaria curta]|nr:hypothetical protein F4679DRAFT_552869 [Xylaria curta]